MIDPKQKAKELVDKFMNLELALGGKYDGYFFMHLDDAKECAKIHVEGILDASPLEPSEADWDDCGSNYAGWYYARRLEAETYWQYVLTEIENL